MEHEARQVLEMMPVSRRHSRPNGLYEVRDEVRAIPPYARTRIRRPSAQISTAPF
jgi:hypothetical protein